MVGATGEYAGLLLPELLKLDISVRALVRDQEKAEKAKAAGAAETVTGDLLDPSSLDAAAQGMDGIFHINPGMDPKETEMGLNMVNAAIKAGVKKFVFSGVYHPSLSMPNHRGKAPVEEALYNSELDFTILQPSAFFQNLDMAFPIIAKTGVFALPYDYDKPMAYVDYRDVAEVAAKSFVDPDLSYGTFELSGPQYTRKQVAVMMSDALDKEVVSAQIGFEEWADRAKIPAGSLREGLRVMYDRYNRFGFRGGNELVLKTILLREPNMLQDYIVELSERTEVTVMV